ncbi:hypothetical protein [Saccharopolyspora phatthalungensis]|uniref:Uncharacterized protein n=1 Tax=Saccharopolyspora phatthalungensis TaxID=664693 RepID=A0A840QF23_9PSEU|nr:hypothetical protein [Saccharopolyspora phatthalungensis]MBB5159026.1 hypothetical protein [Saccharopolyspora phatthalungensis]
MRRPQRALVNDPVDAELAEVDDLRRRQLAAREHRDGKGATRRHLVDGQGDEGAAQRRTPPLRTFTIRHCRDPLAFAGVAEPR